jgi:hypothetical protein
MSPADTPRAPDIESRWPVVVVVIGTLLLLVALPDRVRLLPAWVPYTAAAVMLTPVIGVAITAGKSPWLRLERSTTFAFFIFVALVGSVNLGFLLREMLNSATDISGTQLLTSSIGLWVTNVTNFSLLYWQIDGGGLVERWRGNGRHPDWLFPQSGAAGLVPSDWRPKYVDYLFLGYSTATAFSATDAMPLTQRAKLLMMLEGTFSLITIITVAARAINVLGLSHA